jgi:soluble lytic murein transglycosylase-like protein
LACGHTVSLQGKEVRKHGAESTRAGKAYHAIVVDTARRHDLDPALIKAIIKAESGFDTHAVSEKGAKGLMQLMPDTAKALGVSDVYDPKENVEAGVRYFKGLKARFNGNIVRALAAYHAGAGTVSRHDGVPPYTGTWIYIERVLSYRSSIKGDKKDSLNDR